MKTITIKNIEYNTYEGIRDKLLQEIPHAVNCQYSPNLKIAVFQFKDTKYIPKSLERYITSCNDYTNDIIEDIDNEIELLLQGVINN